MWSSLLILGLIALPFVGLLLVIRLGQMVGAAIGEAIPSCVLPEEYKPLQPSWLGGLARFSDLKEFAAGAGLLGLMAFGYFFCPDPSERTKFGFGFCLFAVVAVFGLMKGLVSYLLSDPIDIGDVIAGKYNSPPPPPEPKPEPKAIPVPLTPGQAFRKLVKKSGRELKEMPATYHELVFDLCFRVRLYDEEQVVTGYFRGDRANMRKALKIALGRGLLGSTKLSVRTIPLDTQPLHIYVPGDPLPDYDALSYLAMKRAEAFYPVERKIYFATRKARGLFGVPNRKNHFLQRNHDLAVSSLYIHFRDNLSGIGLWVGEDALPKTGGKQPDAMLGTSTALEVLGYYDARRIQQFHEFCFERRLRAESW